MRHYKPDRKGLTALRLLMLLLTAALIIAINYSVPIRKVALIADIAVAGVTLLTTLIYLPMYFASVRYTVTDHELIRSSGVFIKYDQSIKFSSIQYTITITTPLSKVTGLNFLLLFVLGGQMNLMFLDYNDMQEILMLTGNGGTI